MSEPANPEALNRFIAAEIESVEQLEILLLLSGNPQMWWTASSVYEVIKSNPASVQTRLDRFVDHQIVTKEIGAVPRYKFSPSNQSIWQIASELREAYKERPVRIVEAIYGRRPDPAVEFAKAFRLKKDPNG